MLCSIKCCSSSPSREKNSRLRPRCHLWIWATCNYLHRWRNRQTWNKHSSWPACCCESSKTRKSKWRGWEFRYKNSRTCSRTSSNHCLRNPTTCTPYAYTKEALKVDITILLSKTISKTHGESSMISEWGRLVKKRSLPRALEVA